MTTDTNATRGFAVQPSRFDHYTPPLRPHADDVRHYRDAVDTWHRLRKTSHPLRGVLLGVTPELARQPWAPGLRLLALDNTPAMISHVWPGDNDWRHALLADWYAPPADAAGADLILGDGVFSLQRYPDDYPRLACTLRGLLREDGRLIVRGFCGPTVPETVAAVLDEARGGRIGGFHAFKWRLAMALAAGQADRSVRVRQVWSAYRSAFPSHAACAEATGWHLPEVSTIEAYESSRASLSFPSVEELLAAVAPAFACVGSSCGGYELAERCPVLALAPRASGAGGWRPS